MISTVYSFSKFGIHLKTGVFPRFLVFSELKNGTFFPNPGWRKQCKFNCSWNWTSSQKVSFDYFCNTYWLKHNNWKLQTYKLRGLRTLSHDQFDYPVCIARWLGWGIRKLLWLFNFSGWLFWCEIRRAMPSQRWNKPLI